jgi:hypothetical protein
VSQLEQNNVKQPPLFGKKEEPGSGDFGSLPPVLHPALGRMQSCLVFLPFLRNLRTTSRKVLPQISLSDSCLSFLTNLWNIDAGVSQIDDVDTVFSAKTINPVRLAITSVYATNASHGFDLSCE